MKITKIQKCEEGHVYCECHMKELQEAKDELHKIKFHLRNMKKLWEPVENCLDCPYLGSYVGDVSKCNIVEREIYDRIEEDWDDFPVWCPMQNLMETSACEQSK